MSPETPDPTPEHAAVAAGLGRVFHAVADATPAVDRRADLLAALDDRAPAGTARPAIRRILPVAAALVLVGAAVVTLAVRGGDGSERTGTADQPSAAVGPLDDPDLDTGWYLPGEGWTITEVQTDYLDIDEGGACPCVGFAAAALGDDDPAVLDLRESSSVSESEDDPPGSETTPIDIGGRAGVRSTGDLLAGLVGISVDTGGRRIATFARGVADEDLVALVDAWADAVDAGQDVDPATLPLPDGFVGTAVQPRDGTFENLVAVTAVHEGTGARVEYQLVPTGYQRNLLLLADTIAAGGPGSLAFVGEIEGEGLVTGAIGGPADVTAGYGFFGSGPATLERDELVAFRDGLREVDVEEWRAALPEGDAVPDEVRAAPTLFAPPLTG